MSNKRFEMRLNFSNFEFIKGRNASSNIGAPSKVKECLGTVIIFGIKRFKSFKILFFFSCEREIGSEKYTSHLLQFKLSPMLSNFF